VSKIVIHVSSPEGRNFTPKATPEYIDYLGEPNALAYHIQTPDKDSERRILSGMDYGKWVPWEATAVVHSGHAEFNGRSLFANASGTARGWLLRYNYGGWPNGYGDNLWSTVNGGEIHKDRVLELPLIGGNRLTITGNYEICEQATYG
jgi:hypothetical protein